VLSAVPVVSAWLLKEEWATLPEAPQFVL